MTLEETVEIKEMTVHGNGAIDVVRTRTFKDADGNVVCVKNEYESVHPDHSVPQDVTDHLDVARSRSKPN